MHGFPDKTDFDGGYTVDGTVNIQVGNYCVTDGQLWITYEQLKKAYEVVTGKVKLHNYECAIEIEMIFNTTGQIYLEGYFRDSSRDGSLEFNIQLDLTYIPSTLKQLKNIVEIYGVWHGIKDR